MENFYAISGKRFDYSGVIHEVGSLQKYERRKSYGRILSSLVIPASVGIQVCSLRN